MITRLKLQFTGPGLKALAMRGTALSFIGFGTSQFIRLASNLVLTRILFPEAFGIMALMQVVLVGLEMFSDMGLCPAVVQSERGDDEAFLNTAWSLQILRGVVLWCAALLLAYPVAQFYERDELFQMIPILAFSLVISGFNSTKILYAHRHIHLGPVIAVGLVSQLIGTLITILIAYLLQSVWGLVLGSLFGAVTKTILSHLVIKGPRNRLAWEQAAFKELFHFGKYLFVATIGAFMVRQGDRLILGKFISLEELGIFTIAFFLAMLPVNISSGPFSKILMPLFKKRPPAASAQNRRKIGKARLLLVGGFVLLALFLALVGENVITLLYDPRYHSAGPILTLFSLSIVPSLIVGGYKEILLANGNSRDFTIYNLSAAFLKITFLLFLVRQFGVVGAVVTPFLVDVITYPLLVYFIRPYKGWYWAQDFGFSASFLLLGGLVIWGSPQTLQLLSVFVQ